MAEIEFVEEKQRDEEVDWPVCGEPVHYFTADTAAGLAWAWPAIVIESWTVQELGERRHLANLMAFLPNHAEHKNGSGAVFVGSVPRGLNAQNRWERISVSGPFHTRNL